MAVMSLYNVTEEALRKEMGAKLIACAHTPRQDMENVAGSVPGANRDCGRDLLPGILSPVDVLACFVSLLTSIIRLKRMQL